MQAYFDRALTVERAQQAKSWERDQGKREEARELLPPNFGWDPGR